jgi:hypothetical protein
MALQNMDEVLKKIDLLAPEIRHVVLSGFDAGLLEVKKHARDSHPPWPAYIFNSDGSWRYHNITTNLTNSIGIRVTQSEAAIIGDVGVLSTTVRADAMEYAAKIERDHPFIQPAMDAKGDEVTKKVAEALAKFFQ